jgi:WD40 repeat protein
MFFTDQLAAFDIWLDFSTPTSDPPEHLPIILQMLLSQTHRLRALQLLKRYLELGPLAVNLSLVVGIHSYVLKLLLSKTEDIKLPLISIWTSILGYDVSCRQELVSQKAQTYFIDALQTSSKGMPPAQLCMSAFILAEICNKYREGQQTCLNLGLHRACTSLLSQTDMPHSSSSDLKKWICLCLFKLCEGYEWAKYLCITELVHQHLYPLLLDSDPQVRTAAVLALGEVFGSSSLADSIAAGVGNTSAPGTPLRGLSLNQFGGRAPVDRSSTSSSSSSSVEDSDLRLAELHLTRQLLDCCNDGAVSVRLEVIKAFSKCLLLPAHIDCIKIVANTVSKRSLQKRKSKPTNQATPVGADFSLPSSLHRWQINDEDTATVINLLVKHLTNQAAAMNTHTTPPDLSVQRSDGGRIESSVIPSAEQQVHAASGSFMDFESSYIGTGASYLPSIQELRRVIDPPTSDDGPPAALPVAVIDTSTATTPSLFELMASVYVALWLAITEVQLKDPCAFVSSAAAMLRCKVFSLIILDQKQQLQKTRAESTGSRGLHSDPLQIQMDHLIHLPDATPQLFYPSLHGTLSTPNTPSRIGSFFRGETGPVFSSDESSFASTRPAGGGGGGGSQIMSSLASRSRSPPPFPLKELKLEGQVDKSAAAAASGLSVETTTSSAAAADSMKTRKLSQKTSSFTSAECLIETKSSFNDPSVHQTSDESDDPSSHHQYLFDDQYLPVEEINLRLTSNTYEEAKKLFLSTDSGYDARLDPLSTVGSNIRYRRSKIVDIMDYQQYLSSLFKEAFTEGGHHHSPSMGEDIIINSSASSSSLQHSSRLPTAAVASHLSSSVVKFEEKVLLTIHGAAMTSLVMFHPFHDIIAVSDETSVSIWSWTHAARIMDINNHHEITHKDQGRPLISKINTIESSIFGPVSQARITAMTWINESYDSLLLLGTDDGVIKIWRDASCSDDLPSEEPSTQSPIPASNPRSQHHGPVPKGMSRVELATAFVALPDMPEKPRASGLICSWQQATGTLLVGGNSSTLRVWDLNREQCVRVFDTGCMSCLTAIASTASANFSSPMMNSSSSSSSVDNNDDDDAVNGSCSVDNSAHSWSFAGFADGTVGIYDERVQSNNGRVFLSRKHGAWVVSAHLRPDLLEVITSCVSGSVKFWDMRTLRTYRTLEVQKSALTSMTVHSIAPIIATGSHDQFIKISSFGGEQLGSVIKYYDGFIGQRIGAVTNLSFHPHRMMLAASTTDCIVSVYATADDTLAHK